SRRGRQGAGGGARPRHGRGCYRDPRVPGVLRRATHLADAAGHNGRRRTYLVRQRFSPGSPMYYPLPRTPAFVRVYTRAWGRWRGGDGRNHMALTEVIVLIPEERVGEFYRLVGSWMAGGSEDQEEAPARGRGRRRRAEGQKLASTSRYAPLHEHLKGLPKD